MFRAVARSSGGFDCFIDGRAIEILAIADGTEIAHVEKTFWLAPRAPSSTKLKNAESAN